MHREAHPLLIISKTCLRVAGQPAAQFHRLHHAIDRDHVRRITHVNLFLLTPVNNTVESRSHLLVEIDRVVKAMELRGWLTGNS